MSYYEELNEDIIEVLNESQEGDHNEDNNYYDLFNSNDFISKPIKSNKCTIDESIIQLQYPLIN